MIGRIDPKRTNENMNYIYLIGSYRLSQELHEISESVNNKTTKLYLDYKYNDPLHPKRFNEKWSAKYKKSINCANPKGFSQKQYCKRKKRGGKYKDK